MKRSSMVAVLVMSDFGPVAGARVWMMATDKPQPIMFALSTGADGKVTHRLPPGAAEADIMVAAPGFARMAFHERVRDGKVLVHVAQPSGNVHLHAPAARTNVHPFIVHNGAVFHVAMFEPVAGEDGSYTLADVEPGPYVRCLGEVMQMAAFRNAVPPELCRGGVVAPGGTLDLNDR